MSILRYLPVFLVRTRSGAFAPWLGLWLGALAVRLGYVLIAARAPVGVGGDAGYYHSAANLIAHGHFLYRSILGGSYPTAEHPPLFPLVLSVVSVFGGDSLLTHRVAGCVIGSLTVVAVAVLGRRVAGARTGWIAGGLAAVFPPLVTADGLVMSEPLFALLVAVSLMIALGPPGRRRSVLLGVAVGLCALTRGEGLALLVLLAWPAAWRAGRWRDVLLSTLVCLAVLAPWVIRNAVMFGRPLLATDSNTLIAGANCADTFYGHDIGWWSLRCMERARTRVQVQQGDASTAAARRYAGDHLGRLPLVAAARVARTFDLFQPLRQGNRELRRRWVDILGLVFFYPVFGLALLTVLRRRAPWELLAPVAMVVIVSALGWGIGRFRVGADVSLLVLAAVTLSGAGITATTRSARRPGRV
ncbi:MAG TPA: glycosyltransferase family 39 protein [Solirubrobacteraceae bacterium]|nr:glycosyltransferase family 39 protein [Solirubrobacteraceae bacterium]